MTLAIIIPTFNEAKGIEKCLLALQPLRQQDCEIIIADGGSNDATKNIAEPLVDHIINAPKGRARQMNAGANIATKDILLFLHADTYLPDNAVTQIHSGLSSNLVWGRFDIQLTGRHFMFKVIAWMINKRSRLTAIATGDQAIFVTRTAFQKISQFPDIALMEDIALCKKLKTLSAPYCIRAKVSSSSRRWQQFGIYKTILLMWWLRAGFFLGIAPEQLAKLYYRGKFWKL